MAQFSFDVVSTYDNGEMNNVYDQVQRELSARYDLKGTHAAVEWLDDKKGLKIYGDNRYHLEALIDLLRKKAATRGIDQKTFDVSKEPETTNLRMIWIVPFKNGLAQDDIKKINKLLRDELPKLKTVVQGDALRVMSSKKDELQAAMQLLKRSEFDFPVVFNNFR